jgi:hypothetical protein
MLTIGTQNFGDRITEADIDIDLLKFGDRYRQKIQNCYQLLKGSLPRGYHDYQVAVMNQFHFSVPDKINSVSTTF